MKLSPGNVIEALELTADVIRTDFKSAQIMEAMLLLRRYNS